MTYYQLYLKYKNKYINLKKQIGSASLEFQESSNELILPCEINHNTSNLYISNLSDRNELFEKLQNIIRGSQIRVIKINHSFAQDANILLKDINDNTKHYAIKTNTVSTTYPFNNSEIKLYTNCNEFLNVYNGNHFGGNFISSPENIIFTFDNSPFSECLDSNLKSNLIQLNCSFRYSNERHIDETMCFMPYGINSYKVWIYEFRKIEFDNTLIRVKNILESEKIDNIIEQFNTLKIKYTEGETDEDALKNFDLLAEFKMTYWHPTDLKALKNKLGLLNFNLEFDEIITRLNIERQENLELISQILFNGSYEDNSDNFVFFPLDVYIDEEQNYKITNVPIFNRLYIETEEIKHCIFSISNQGIDPDILQILNREREHLRSYIDNKKIICSYFKTSGFNNEGNVGGNLHCLVKNQYS